MKAALKKIEALIKKNEKNVFKVGAGLLVLAIISHFFLDEDDSEA